LQRQSSNQSTLQSPSGSTNISRANEPATAGTRTPAHQPRTAASSISSPTDLNSRQLGSPGVETVVNSDLEKRARSSEGRQKILRQGKRWTTSGRPVLDGVPMTAHQQFHRQQWNVVSGQPFRTSQDAPGDERLTEKYNQLRRLLLDKLDLRTLTPQVSYIYCFYVETGVRRYRRAVSQQQLSFLS